MGAGNSAEAEAAFRATDLDGDGKITPAELMTLVERNPPLWSMLHVNTGLDEAYCKAVALEVAHKKFDANGDGRISLQEFRALHATLLACPRGQLEFFHETLFAAFDADGNGKLDETELDRFLELFYEESSIFSGDRRLPPKQALKERALRELERDNDGKLSFEELRPMLTGGFPLAA